MRERMIGALANEGLGSKSDAHTGKIEHGEIVRSVAHSNHLFERDLFLRGDLLQQRGLAGSINDRLDNLAGDGSVGEFQLVGVNVVNAEAGLQVTREECKTT